MRASTSGLTIALLVLIPLSRTSAADTEKPSPINLDASLTDGSRIKGEIPLPHPPYNILSPALGKLSVPLSQIAVINFNANHTEVTVHLQNGDTVQGTLAIDSVRMKTLFGLVTVPFSAVKELQFHSRESDDSNGVINPGDWDLLPFPQDSDWPGNRGVPPRFENGEVILQGAQDARSKKLYSAPLTVECEVVLEARASSQGEFQLRFVAEGQPRDLDAKQLTSLAFAYRQNGTDQLFVVQHPSPQQDLRVLANTPIRAGRAYHIRIHIQPDHWRVDLNDESYEMDGISMPAERFYIQLYGWEPQDRWHVRNFKAY
jgi:hypothetical protein